MIIITIRHKNLMAAPIELRWCHKMYKLGTAGVRLKMDPPKKVPPGPFSTVENGPPGPFSIVENGPPLCKMDPPGPFFAVENGPPGQFSPVENAPPPLGMLGILQTLPPVPFHYTKWTPPPGPLFAVVNSPAPHLCKMDPPPPPPGQLYAVVNGPPLGKLGILQTLPPVTFHYAKWTPGPFSPVEYGPPGPFSPVENGPPVHFSPW